MKFIFRLVFIFLFSWLLYLIPSKFLTLDFFKVKEIKIEGSPKMLSRELTEMIKIIYNSNIWDIDLKGLEEYLEKDMRIERAKIRILGLGKIEIDIKERELAYYLQTKNRIYLIDTNGKKFGYLKERLEKDTYFIVIKDESELEKLLQLGKRLDDSLLKILISQLYMKDENCIEIILLDGTIIKTNLDVEDEKYKVLETLYNELAKTKKIEYIDIRFNDFIVKSLEEKKSGDK
ncbi:MAG: cell division protein FtsQ/DivIB [Fusobacterium mortiferum]|uniref:cell division protein FtsQ/DivIB n=1 Tax=Fusobacterium mortiferum TaxID=850 RepID=UPI001F277591|nr:cell division protein FtsQ/DivIB [Fusobacterium mortiferum]MCF2628495.1 cell division protein FtsQ/DivIB [Fusobacterium mortiferum]MCI6381809.1 FtsQ-type POTRA domain-containing protein [Fusobacterium mortiferum]